MILEEIILLYWFSTALSIAFVIDGFVLFIRYLMLDLWTVLPLNSWWVIILLPQNLQMINRWMPTNLPLFYCWMQVFIYLFILYCYVYCFINTSSLNAYFLNLLQNYANCAATVFFFFHWGNILFHFISSLNMHYTLLTYRWVYIILFSFQCKVYIIFLLLYCSYFLS